MVREPDLETVNRALGETFKKQEQELVQLRKAMHCAIEQIEDRLHMAARQTLINALLREGW